MDQIVNLAMFTMDRTVTQSVSADALIRGANSTDVHSTRCDNGSSSTWLLSVRWTCGIQRSRRGFPAVPLSAADLRQVVHTHRYRSKSGDALPGLSVCLSDVFQSAGAGPRYECV